MHQCVFMALESYSFVLAKCHSVMNIKDLAAVEKENVLTIEA